MSEFRSRHQAANIEKLQLYKFSFITRPNRVKPAEPERLIQLDRLPFDQRVIDFASYALELSTHKLKPLDYANSRLGSIEPGTHRAIELIDDAIIAEAVHAELVKSFEVYSPEMYGLVTRATEGCTAGNVGWLKAIHRMRNDFDPQKKVGFRTGQYGEAVARLTIARELGIQIPSDADDWPASVE